RERVVARRQRRALDPLRRAAPGAAGLGAGAAVVDRGLRRILRPLHDRAGLPAARRGPAGRPLHAAGRLGPRALIQTPGGCYPVSPRFAEPRGSANRGETKRTRSPGTGLTLGR